MLLANCDGGDMQIQEEITAAGGNVSLSSDPVRCPGQSPIRSVIQASTGDEEHITVFPNGASAWSVIVVTR